MVGALGSPLCEIGEEIVVARLRMVIPEDPGPQEAEGWGI
jgi:hypothetical protein